MKVICLGGGPAGLYLAISMKLRDPSHEVVVVERNKPTDTFGWGVVLSDETMEHLRANDPVSAAEVLSNFAHWDDVEVSIQGESHRSSGHGFCGIGRMKLLNLLQARALELGAQLQFETETTAEDIERYRQEYDLVVACDGLNSLVRRSYESQFKLSLIHI